MCVELLLDKKLWKIRTGLQAVAAHRSQGLWATGPSGCQAVAGHWAAGLLLAKPCIKYHLKCNIVLFKQYFVVEQNTSMNRWTYLPVDVVVTNTNNHQRFQVNWFNQCFGLQSSSGDWSVENVQLVILDLSR